MTASAYCLFFDLNGTLTEPSPGITACLAHALRGLGRPAPPPSRLRGYIGPPLRESFAELLGTADTALVEEAVRLYRERFSTIGIFENELHPGVEAALGELLADGFRLAVVTSKPQQYAERILAHFRIDAWFSGVYGAELSGDHSSKAELIARALQAEAAVASRACMIGDRHHDVSGARARGVSSIGVTWGYGTAVELMHAGAEAVIDTLAELPAACRSCRDRVPVC